uniref:Uncharacterized protein n=1 Tax=Aegilops tauschii TaxID=37682 RepID=M8C8G8_AEGTA
MADTKVSPHINGRWSVDIVLRTNTVPAQPEPARRRDGVERLLGERAALNVGRSANGVRANADADTSARKKAEEAEAKRKAEEAEARKKKEDEERDAELAAYYQQQWANEEDGVADGVQGEETAPLNRPSGLRCGVSENPGWGEFPTLLLQAIPCVALI